MVFGVVAAVSVALLWDVMPWAKGAQEVNPFARTPLHVRSDSKAAVAAREAADAGRTDEADTLKRLAAVPTGIWLTPETHPRGAVGALVRQEAAAANEAGRLPLLVVYGITDRDCVDGLSSGGLPPEDYRAWVREIAEASTVAEKVAVVLEPDALATLVGCTGQEQRLGLLRDAVEVLRSNGATTYIDAGHSSWVPVEAMATRLRSVGVESVRGFALNVSNFETDEDELAYGDALVEALGGGHYVIDTGRNGGGPALDEAGERVWCNPSGRRLGTPPGPVDDDSALDAHLWVKPPGESDGECGGGPPAGDFWVERALELASAAGW
ncbi:glycoside hydrolase family 6 protein [Myroides odoratimimus subsp. xuanwuensis]